MKKIATLLMAAAVLLGAGMTQARAAEAKPIAALAVTNYNNLMADINYVGGLVERPQLGAMAEGLISLVTQGKGLAGVDKTRPWGAIIEASGEENIVGYVCVPITDFKAAKGLLKQLNESVEKEGDVYKVTPKNGGKVNYVKEHGKWACFSDKAESLANIASDPLAVLSGLEKNYIVAGRIFLANIPEGLRDKVMVPLKANMEREAGEKKDDETDAQFADRKKLIEQAEAYIVRVAGDLDQINVGWGLDRSSEKTYADLSLTFKAGSKTAQETAAEGAVKSNFAGFRSSSAASTWAIASVIPEAKQEIATSLLAVIRGKAMSDIEKKTPEDKRALAKEVTGEGLDLVTKIIKSGRIDAVGTGIISEKSATGLAAFFVSDGELFDKILHTIVKAIEEEHSEIDQFVKLDASTVDGLHVHKVSLPIPEGADNREAVVKYIGETLDIVVAVGKENVYIAAGRDAGPTLKKAVAASIASGAKSVIPIAVSYSIQPIVSAVAIVGKPHDRPMAKLIGSELKKTPGKDHISLTVQPITNGAQVRLEVEQGLLRLAGRMAVMKQEGKLPPEGDSEN